MQNTSSNIQIRHEAYKSRSRSGPDWAEDPFHSSLLKWQNQPAIALRSLKWATTLAMVRRKNTKTGKGGTSNTPEVSYGRYAILCSDAYHNKGFWARRARRWPTFIQRRIQLRRDSILFQLLLDFFHDKYLISHWLIYWPSSSLFFSLPPAPFPLLLCLIDSCLSTSLCLFQPVRGRWIITARVRLRAPVSKYMIHYYYLACE